MLVDTKKPLLLLTAYHFVANDPVLLKDRESVKLALIRGDVGVDVQGVFFNCEPENVDGSWDAAVKCSGMK